jgi:hypothetical protein
VVVTQEMKYSSPHVDINTGIVDNDCDSADDSSNPDLDTNMRTRPTCTKCHKFKVPDHYLNVARHKRQVLKKNCLQIFGKLSNKISKRTSFGTKKN